MRSLSRRALHWVPRCLVALALGSVVAAVHPRSAAAQTAQEVAGARTLAGQGMSAFESGEWEKAYDFFARAETLYHAPPHLLYMARSCEKLGRLVEAFELYNRVVREQPSPQAPEAFRRAHQSAVEEIRELEPRLAHVTVRLEGAPADSVEVRANGKTIPAALLGVSRSMDPGAYEFTVVAENVRAEPVTLTVTEGAEETVVLQLSPVEKQPAASAVLTPSAADSSERSSLKIPAYVALGVGAVGVGLGTVFLIDHLDKGGRADELFDDKGCAQDGACTVAEQREIKDLSSQSATSGTLSIVGFGVGAAALGTGVLLLLLDDESPEQAALRYQREPHVRLLLGVQSVGLAGRF